MLIYSIIGITPDQNGSNPTRTVGFGTSVRNLFHKRNDVPVSRLTNDEYLIAHGFLQDAWNEFRSVFTLFSYNDQMILHEFYATTKDWTDEELLAHRRQITAAQPSLPQRAGKLYTQFQRHAVEVEKLVAQRQAQPAQVKTARSGPKGKRQIRVRALARPEPDVKKIAMALLGLAKDMQAEENAKQHKKAV